MLCNSLTQQLSCKSLDTPNSSWFPQGLEIFHNPKEQLLEPWPRFYLQMAQVGCHVLLQRGHAGCHTLKLLFQVIIFLVLCLQGKRQLVIPGG